MKRLVDLSVSFILLIILLPLALLISLLILYSMGWPVIFCHVRPGLHGQSFGLLKFRTMTERRDEQGNYLSDAERLTSVGKMLRRSSADELPQLVNVFKGEMSLVGPRPLLMEYLDRYTSEQSRRHDVKPGITGWAQVKGRNVISWEEKFKYDVWYVDNRSFFLDIKIMCITLLKVLKGEGISQVDHVSARPYEGEDN